MAFYRVFLFAVVAFVSLEGLIFRTGFYARYLDPISSTGTFEGTLRDEIHRRQFGPDEVLVTGDSRMGEGFSAKTANAARLDHRYYFANVAVPGATPRCIYYLLRDLDPSRRRYRAIILPVESYEDIDGYNDFADRLLDLHLCVVRLRYSDLLEFAHSFTTGRRRMEAFRGGLFKGIVFQSDLLGFFEHGQQRLADVAGWREHGWEWQNDYPGREEDLSGMQVNWSEKTIRFPERLNKSERDDIFISLFGPVPQQNGRLARYRSLWFGRILDLYRNSDTKLIFLTLPRGPVVPPVQRVRPLSHSIRDLGRSRGVILLPDDMFRSLEQGAFYFDNMHLNKLGRTQFSSMLAESIRMTLGPSRN